MTTAPTPDDTTKRATALFEEIAALALRTDRHCHFEHDRFELAERTDELSVERINLELAYLRDVIRRLGWTADLGYALLTELEGPRQQVRGGAEAWILSPSHGWDEKSEAVHG